MDARVPGIIEQMRSGMTLESIGAQLGITRERVRQIANKHPDYQSAQREGHAQTRKAVCRVCGTATPAGQRCEACRMAPHPCLCGCGNEVVYPKLQFADGNCRHRYYYHHVEGKKAKQHAATRRWQRDHREQYLAIQNRAVKKWQAKNRAKIRERDRERYRLRYKTDPVYRQHVLDLRRANYRKRKQEASVRQFPNADEGVWYE